MTKCRHCNRNIGLLENLIDVRHQLGWCKDGGEEE